MHNYCAVDLQSKQVSVTIFCLQIFILLLQNFGGKNLSFRRRASVWLSNIDEVFTG